ncbi:Ubiquitin conjugation factor E4 A [Nymphon striatum]|nr:Ubiquitin conjugation factor E4 A [Nymphon striatum]
MKTKLFTYYETGRHIEMAMGIYEGISENILEHFTLGTSGKIKSNKTMKCSLSGDALMPLSAEFVLYVQDAECCNVEMQISISKSKTLLSDSGIRIMERKKITDNPFAALFPTIAAAQEFCDENEHNSNPTESNNKIQNEIAQFIFCITLDKDYTDSSSNKSSCVVFLSELNSEIKKSMLNSDVISQAVFDRLMLSEILASDIIMTDNCSEDVKKYAAEKRIIPYLHFCYTRLKVYEKKCQVEINFLKLCETAIIKNTVTALNDSGIFNDESINEDFIKLLSERAPFIFEYVNAVSVHVYEEKQISGVCDTFNFLFNHFDHLFGKSSFANIDAVFQICLLHSMISKSVLMAEALIVHSTPEANATGKAYELSLLGMLLSPSCLPSNNNILQNKYPFFQKPSRVSSQEHQITQNNISQIFSQRNDILYDFFYTCLKSSLESRNRILYWFGNCIKANLGRSRISNRENLVDLNLASDGFMLNLTSVFLHLCKPFVTKDKLNLLLGIAPSYIKEASKVDECSGARGIHLQVPKDETCLIPFSETMEKSDNSDKIYNFTTECFFMTHLCLHSGFCVAHSKLLQVSQSLSRQQHLYDEVMAQVGSTNSETAENIITVMEKGMTQFLSLKAALLVPDHLDMMMKFLTSSSIWLVNKAYGKDSSDITDNLKFPLLEVCSKNLVDIPEYLLENIADFVIFLRRFNPHTLEAHGLLLDKLMTVILAFMGNSKAVKNPHLRAKLAEMLECLMPHDEEEIKINQLVANYHRNTLFHSHPYITHLMRTLLEVFVSIEVTGESVEFEQKFNYRRPMYIVLKYIWNVELHRDSLKSLAEEAEPKMESVEPPLFLRFINLLINDAIFLLDEALSYMSQLREHQQRRDHPDYTNQPHDQRSQDDRNFHHMGMLAQFHNVMSNETIHTLMLITGNIKSIFMYSVMVDRVAAMLNYFLVHLIGPKKKQFKVKNLKDYEFKPQQIVSDICQIYLNLGYVNNDSDSFCSAIVADSRSYTPLLFQQTISVLKKISQANLIVDFEEFSIKIKNIHAGNQKMEEALSDAPEEFLDPIMNTLMSDPVLLPTSNMIVDRSTIARHLLSDQTDPFNRSPLNMEMVKTDKVLKGKIQEWISSRKSR